MPVAPHRVACFLAKPWTVADGAFRAVAGEGDQLLAASVAVGVHAGRGLPGHTPAGGIAPGGWDVEPRRAGGAGAAVSVWAHDPEAPKPGS